MTESDARYDDGALRITWTGNPLVVAIAGEIDESTFPALIRRLSDLADGQREICVNLAGLTFCDVVGLRAIVRLTGAGSGQSGRRLVLQEVPQHLMKLLQILGWDTTPGLLTDQHGAHSTSRPASALSPEPAGMFP